MVRNVFDLSKRDLEWVNPKELDGAASIKRLGSKWIDFVHGTVLSGVLDARKLPDSSLANLTASQVASTVEELKKNHGIVEPIIECIGKEDTTVIDHENSLAEIRKLWKKAKFDNGKAKSKISSADNQSPQRSEMYDVSEQNHQAESGSLPRENMDANELPDCNSKLNESNNSEPSTKFAESPIYFDNFSMYESFLSDCTFSQSTSVEDSTHQQHSQGLHRETQGSNTDGHTSSLPGFPQFSVISDPCHSVVAGPPKSPNHSQRPTSSRNVAPDASKPSHKEGSPDSSNYDTVEAQLNATLNSTLKRFHSTNAEDITQDPRLKEIFKSQYEEGNKVYEEMAKEDTEFQFSNPSTSIPGTHNLPQDFYDFLQKAGLNLEAIEEFSDMKRIPDSNRPFTDRSPVVGNYMPILAPPIPPFALRQSSCLSTFVTESFVPGRFQWACESPNQRATYDVQAYKQNTSITDSKSSHGARKKRVSVESDLIVLVYFYHSMGTSPFSSRNLKTACKIEILGRQTLSDLRNLLYCRTDALDEEIMDNQVPQPDLEGDRYKIVRKRNMEKLSVFFIGSKAYHSKRSETSDDYADIINNWNTFIGAGAPRFETCQMENTRIMDLDFKTGFPYAFFHNEGCEHLLVFQRVSLPHPNSKPFVDSYPFITNISMRRINCEIDNENIAKFIVINFDGFPNETTFVCAECLASACYSKGKKISDFRVCPCYQAFDTTRVASEQLSTAEYAFQNDD